MPKLMKELILMNEGIPAFPVHQPYYPQQEQSLRESSETVSTIAYSEIEDISLLWYKYKYEPEELKKREDIIARHDYYSYCYARYILKGPFPKGEEAIAKDAYYSYMYAQDVLNRPFSKGEAIIATSAGYSYAYAKNVLKSRFHKGEACIMKSQYAEQYKHFL